MHRRNVPAGEPIETQQSTHKVSQCTTTPVEVRYYKETTCQYETLYYQHITSAPSE